MNLSPNLMETKSMPDNNSPSSDQKLDLYPEEFAQLFDDDFVYSLSEIDTEVKLYPYHAAGEELADLHRRGFIYRDFHPDNFIIDSERMFSHGQTVLLDALTLEWDIPINPANMAPDFLAPFVTLEKSQFIALLSGYAKSSYVMLDNIYPNFTDQLLNMLGGRPTKKPRPRKSRCNVLEFTRELGIDFEINGSLCRIITIDQHKVRERLNSNPEPLYLLAFGLFISEIDIERLLLSAPEDPILNTIHSFLQGSTLPSNVVSDSDMVNVGITFVRHLDFISEKADDRTNKPIQEISQRVSEFVKFIMTISDNSSYKKEFIEFIIDTLVYSSNFILKNSQEEISIVAALTLGQSSYMLLHGNPRKIEVSIEEYLYLDKALVKHGWEDFLSMQKLLVSTTPVIISNLQLIQVRANMLSQLFKYSIDNRTPVLSIGWDALNSIRNCVSILNQFVQDPLKERISIRVMVDFSRPLIDDYLKILENHIAFLINSQLIGISPDHQIVLANEFYWLKKLTKDCFRGNTPNYKKLKKQLKQIDKYSSMQSDSNPSGGTERDGMVMNWEPDVLERWKNKEVVLPEDWIGAIFVDDGVRYEIRSILGQGESSVVFETANLRNRKIFALSIFRHYIDPINSLKDEMNEIAKNDYDPDKMIEVCNKILERKPDSEPAIFNKGIAFLQKGYHKEALDAFSLAVSLAPQDVIDWLHRALCFAVLKDDHAAITDVQVALDIDNSTAISVLETLSESMEPIKASFERVLKNEPENPIINQIRCCFK